MCFLVSTRPLAEFSNSSKFCLITIKGVGGCDGGCVVVETDNHYHSLLSLEELS